MGRLEGKYAIVTGARKGITANAIAPCAIDTDMQRSVPEESLKALIAKMPGLRLGKVEELPTPPASLQATSPALSTAS